MNEGSIHVFLQDRILYLARLLCVVVQHNNKLQTIENKQGNGVGVRCKNAEFRFLYINGKYLKQPKNLSLNTCKLHSTLTSIVMILTSNLLCLEVFSNYVARCFTIFSLPLCLCWNYMFFLIWV